MVQVIIPGKPLALKRVRGYIHQGKIMFFDSQAKEKRHVINAIKKSLSDLINWETLENLEETRSLLKCDQFFVSLDFHMPLPIKLNLSKKNAILSGVSKFNKKPDIDNLVKFYLDCSNGILFPDDRMIIQLQASKIYSKEPKTIITVTPF